MNTTPHDLPDLSASGPLWKAIIQWTNAEIGIEATECANELDSILHRELQTYATAAVEQDRASAPPDGSWRQAIDEALIGCALDCTSSHDDPRAALSRLIDWHVQVALDPSVSSAAQALLDTDRAQRDTIAPRDCLWARNGHQCCPTTQPAHTEAEVQQLMLCVADWDVERSQYEALVRSILGVPK